MDSCLSVEEEKEEQASSSSSLKLRDFYAQHGVRVDDLLLEEKPNNHNDLLLLPHRFIRLNPRFNATETLQLLEKELSKDDSRSCPYPMAVPWLDSSSSSSSFGGGFYALPGDFSLSNCPLFRQGRIYGQDVSSGAAVAALLTCRYDANNKQKEDKQQQENNADEETTVAEKQEEEPSEFRVLDLCCAPGLKLCAMADWLSEKNENDTVAQRTRQLTTTTTPTLVVGVDVSESRMAVCKRVLHKYHIDPETSCGHDNNTGSSSNVRIQLYCNDGTIFGKREEQELNLIFDSGVAREELNHRGKRKRMNKSAKARERKRLKQIQSLEEQPATAGNRCSQNTLQLFDRVLVDAECSTDGSLKHVQKRLSKEKKRGIQSTDEELIPQLTDSQQLSELVNLQRRLAASGFRLLKRGGCMVYSTCSFSEEQNEKVIKCLLEEYKDARIVPIDFSPFLSSPTDRIVQGSIPGTVRFLPPNTRTESQSSPSSDKQETSADNNLFGGGFFLAKITKT